MVHVQMFSMPCQEQGPSAGLGLQLLLEEKYSSRIYCHGSYICSDPGLASHPPWQIGLNFTGSEARQREFRLSTDRNWMDVRRLVQLIPLLYTYLKQQQPPRHKDLLKLVAKSMQQLDKHPCALNMLGNPNFAYSTVSTAQGSGSWTARASTASGNRSSSGSSSSGSEVGDAVMDADLTAFVVDLYALLKEDMQKSQGCAGVYFVTSIEDKHKASCDDIMHAAEFVAMTQRAACNVADA